MNTPELSVIVPVYNEEQGLAALFDRLYPALDKLNISYEIIFINDASPDDSLQKAIHIQHQDFHHQDFCRDYFQ